ncbi:MAG TPA: hypothetical protein PLE82_05500, partial [Saccharofermentans sp.]|nr:hypothetical protein [Saccharofermentans sp.]
GQVKDSRRREHPEGATDCSNCDKETLVHASDGYICLSCGSRCEESDFVACTRCGKPVLMGDDMYCYML